MRRIRYRVEGRVQGVGFRAHTSAGAQRLGLGGFVRNRRDGSVEGEAQGDPAAVAAFVALLEAGPAWASVARVVVEDVAPEPAAAAFEVRR